MKTTTIAAVALGSSLTMAACTSWPMFGGVVRPECTSQSHIVYYNFHEEDLRASTGPIIRRIAQQVAACEKAGGELESVTIVGFPNRTDNSTGGDETAAARGRAVLDALIAAGLPAEKTKLASYRLEDDDIDQPMRRRAEIAVEMR